MRELRARAGRAIRLLLGPTDRDVERRILAQERSPLRRLAAMFHPRSVLHRRRVVAQCRALEAAGVFDRAFYLDRNPDVAASGMDPLLHFVMYGAAEGRAASPLAAFGESFFHEKFPVPGEPSGRALLRFAEQGLRPGGLPRPRTDAAACADELAALVRGREFLLAVSHDDYLRSLGGVQICLADEHEALAAEGVSYVQAYPTLMHPTLRSPGELLVTVQADGRALGVVRGEDLPELLGALVERHGRECRGVAIHHLLGWSLEVVDRVLSRLRTANVTFWVHDFFSVCPQHTLLRNGHTFCGAPPVESDSCRICDAGRARAACQPRVREFLARHRPRVAAPSAFALQLWAREFPEHAAGARVLPPARVRRHASPDPARARDAEDRSRRPRLAYPGFPVAKKGWETWKRVAADPAIAGAWELLHLGRGGSEDRAGRFVPVEVTRADRGAMIRALESNAVDAVLLWTRCAETFSFVLQEAIAARCFVITRPGTGNIAATIEAGGGGVVLDDEDALLRFLREPDAARRVLADHFRREAGGVLERNPALRDAWRQPRLVGG